MLSPTLENLRQGGGTMSKRSGALMFIEKSAQRIRLYVRTAFAIGLGSLLFSATALQAQNKVLGEIQLRDQR
jgi:hypothetical protein